VAALFDRNKSVFSAFFDIFLAAMVTCLATLIIFRGIYADFSLLMLAFVIAGSQVVQKIYIKQNKKLCWVDQ
jgi:hypothetical protein